MRELFLGMAMALDGFVCGPEGEIEWIFSGDEEAIAWKLENAWNASLPSWAAAPFRAWPVSGRPLPTSLRRR